MDSEASTRAGSSIAIDIAGAAVHLLAGKALYWPDAKVLCIADVHFGKAAAFRALGQPVPGGTTAANLARIDALLGSSDVREIVFLGDLFHAKKSLTDDVIATIADWRQRHASLEVTLIRGNHDRRAGALPASLGIVTVNEPHVRGPFALCHSMIEHPTHHAIAGHIHPVFVLTGLAHQSVRLPCFVTSTRSTLLPSFGEFTGGFDVRASPGDRVFVTDGSQIWPLR
jgi:DNA ligase-associated metallophosphoesterase